MTPDMISALRKSLGENVATFGARFARSGRTVEDWEQGRRNPDKLAMKMMERLSHRYLSRIMSRTSADTD